MARPWRAVNLVAGLLVLALVLVGVRWFEPAALRTLAPLWARAATLLDADFIVIGVGQGRDGAGTPALRMEFAPARHVVIGLLVLDPAAGHRGTAVMPLGAVWLSAALFAALLAGWPMTQVARGVAHSRTEWALRVVFGAVCLALMLGMTVPAQLLGQMRAVLAEQAMAVGWQALPVLGGFLAQGGRLALAVALAAACAVAAARLSAPRRRPGQA